MRLPTELIYLTHYVHFLYFRFVYIEHFCLFTEVLFYLLHHFPYFIPLCMYFGCTLLSFNTLLWFHCLFFFFNFSGISPNSFSLDAITVGFIFFGGVTYLVFVFLLLLLWDLCNWCYSFAWFTSLSTIWFQLTHLQCWCQTWVWSHSLCRWQVKSSDPSDSYQL